MKGDKLLFQNHHRLKAQRLVDKIIYFYSHIEDKLVVTLGGESGTGKTEIAYNLREMLYKKGLRAQLISLDDYYKVKWSIRNKVREETNAKNVGINEIDWELLDATVEAFKNNKEENLFRQLNKYIDDYEYTYFNDDSVDILIIEGLYALDINKSDLRIYLEGGYKETRSFRLERGKEKQGELRNKILEKECIDIRKTLKNAYLLVTFDGKICQNEN